jgi:hypothetical protein
MFKAAIQGAMTIAEQKTLRRPLATVSVRHAGEKLNIFDELLLPREFFRTPDPEPSKRAIVEALRAKIDVPGAELVDGGETLAISRR